MTTPNTPAVQGGALVASLATEAGAMTVAQLKANRELMKQAMAEVMEKDKHYGVIKGTDKPTLLKPGAELLCVLFRVNAKPQVEDLGTVDCIRYRVIMEGIHIPTGQVIAHGVGECSTDEEKYKWRRAASKDEWDETPEDRRRFNFKSEVNQVRTNPADAANTVLKMAKKRAQVDLVLSFSAASDVFSQDLDDLAEWLREKETGETGDTPAPAGKGSSTKAPQAKAASTAAQTGAINAGQLDVLKQAADRAGVGETDLCKRYELGRLEDLPFAKLNDAITYCKKVQDGGAQ
jgi:hypothetical protein